MGELAVDKMEPRYGSLDGLRGLAALVVLIHHCFLVSPLLAQAAESRGRGEIESWVWLSTFTPLHLFWAGREAVYVFFVLSGFVLSLPFIGNSSPNWAAYIPRRLVRIYPPVWASLVIALTSSWLIGRKSDPTFSWWVNMHDEPLSVQKDSLLLLGTSSLNSPLWSLQWEVVFSLLLPLFVVAAVWMRRFWILGLSLLILLIGAADMINMVGPSYLPIFGVGVLMAAKREQLHSWANTLGGWTWRVLFGGSLGLMSVQWFVPEFPVARAASTLGAAVLVFVFIGSKMGVSLGRNSVIHWLGTRSFSLYLIHEAVVMAVTFGLGTTNFLLVTVIAVPTSLMAAEVFFRFVERPCHRLSVVIGKTIAKLTGPTQQRLLRQS